MTLIYILSGALIGTIIGWLYCKSKIAKNFQIEKESLQSKFYALELEYAAFKATKTEEVKTLGENIVQTKAASKILNETLDSKIDEILKLNKELGNANANLNAANNIIETGRSEIEKLKKELDTVKSLTEKTSQELATASAKNESLIEKLETQKKDIEELGKKFNTEFENIANRIFETKTEKFTELNKTNLKAILEPLGQNIDEFKKTVNDTYDKESKERFSLGEKVKELAQLNQQISEEARNLTNALKSEVKTQGRWGEMILEAILEKSGLRKGEEYFMEYQLTDENDIVLKSDSEGKKMRPDAVIKYPDNRNVIIDSKVSLNAFIRYLEASDPETQKKELTAHINAVKNHIVALSAKGYDDYSKSLDFVMMFIPSEPAYITALQGDPNIWNFAYDKRILLLNPTNLITSLKLIVDLWKREYQNQNAQEIATRGAKLYDKFVGFVANLEDIGKHIDKAKDAYSDSYKQLYSGNDNLVLQATKLKNLGIKNKKELSKELTGNSELLLQQ
ncbi:MAG: DNA recombination protein RmuC [Bacteroidales bacterium]|nr:DNA recombination protein RmuC [Bacteroidales bacterium]